MDFDFVFTSVNPYVIVYILSSCNKETSEYNTLSIISIYFSLSPKIESTTDRQWAVLLHEFVQESSSLSSCHSPILLRGGFLIPV